MYESMLSRAENHRKSLEKDYNNIENIYGNPLKNINSLYEITSAKG